jgi:nucleoid-associated protein YgaU
MTGALQARIVVPSVVLVALASTALVFGITQMRRAPLVEVKAAADGPAALRASSPVPSPASPRAEEPAATAVATALAETGAVAAALSGPAAPGPANDRAPVFDVARIESSGDAVIAGRAAPGASVELLRNGEVHDRAVADKAGQFVMVPPRLPSGDYELTLRANQPDGKQAISKTGVSVALHQKPKDTPVVALQQTPKDTPVVALQQTPKDTPAGALQESTKDSVAALTPRDRASVVAPKPTTPAVAQPVAVELVDAEPGGKLSISGHSSPGAALRLYVNNSYLASSKASADGRFAFTINKDVGPGTHHARLDEVVSKSGAVRARAEVPFDVPEAMPGAAAMAAAAATADHTGAVRLAKHDDTAGAAGAAGGASEGSSFAAVPKNATTIATTVVVRGDSLWRISRATYGAGERYTLIFGANHAQIRNPNRIYPGQVFVLPEMTP